MRLSCANLKSKISERNPLFACLNNKMVLKEVPKCQKSEREKT